MSMQEIIDLINEAEQKAAEIKNAALEKAAEIASVADERAANIEKVAEADGKALRERSQRETAVKAQKLYDDEITASRVSASQYCTERLKDTDKIVNEIVRRVVRGSR